MIEVLLFKDLTDLVLKSFYGVYNELRYGFLENVYQNALAYELRSKGLSIEVQKKISVEYKNIIVGNYFADIMIDNKIIVELKACDNLVHEHQFQLINYLKSTDPKLAYF
jgi:GxxExxY protein